MPDPLRFHVDIDVEGDGYVLCCRRLGTYRWRGATPEEALRNFSDDIKRIVERFERERRHGAADPGARRPPRP